MRADNSRHVVAAARRRAEQTRERAVAALRRMDATGQRITFDTVARGGRLPVLALRPGRPNADSRAG